MWMFWLNPCRTVFFPLSLESKSGWRFRKKSIHNSRKVVTFQFQHSSSLVIFSSLLFRFEFLPINANSLELAVDFVFLSSFFFFRNLTTSNSISKFNDSNSFFVVCVCYCLIKIAFCIEWQNAVGSTDRHTHIYTLNNRIVVIDG